MISEDMLKIGLAKGVVRLIDSPNDGEPACQIGEHWFYYAGSKGTGMSTEAYVRETLFEDIIHEILDALVSILADVNKDEYLYYEAVLRENGCEPVPRAYVVRVSESNSIQVTTAKRMINKLLSFHESYLQACRDSFLPEDMIKGMIQLMESRIERLA